MKRCSTIRITSVDKEKIIGQEIIGGDDKSYDKNKIIEIELNRNIYLGLLAEMKKAGVIVDEELKCFNNRIFTIVEMTWNKPVKGLNIIPTVFGVALRRDIENIISI